MFRSSSFNIVEYYDETAMIYNSLNGHVARVDNAGSFRELLCSGKVISELLDNKLKKMFNDGFIVSDINEERLRGKMRFYERIFNSTLSLVLLSTEQCNFRCKYCYESFSRGKMSDTCQKAIVNYVKKNISEYKAVDISWFGGEPLLAIDVIENVSTSIIKICHDLGKPYTSSITTNGYFLSPSTLDRLRKCRVTGFQITLDGPEEIHNQGRVLANGEGTFDVIINNLKGVRDNCKGETFKVDIRINVTERLLPHLEKFIEFLHFEFSRDKRFSFYFRPVGDWGGERAKDMTDNMVHSFSTYYNIIENSLFTLNTDAYIQLLNAPLCMSAMRNHFIIGSDSSIYKCTMLFDNPQNKIGTLLDDGHMVINEDLHAKWVMRVFENEECQSCFYFPLCSGGTCPAIGTAISGERCGYEKNSIRHVLKLIYLDSATKNSRAKVTRY